MTQKLFAGLPTPACDRQLGFLLRLGIHGSTFLQVALFHASELKGGKNTTSLICKLKKVYSFDLKMCCRKPSDSEPDWQKISGKFCHKTFCQSAAQ